ncbi:hypothetical protein [Arcanobacterium phocae]|uniref:hypothetical protein n=1 Tax=Arcanobacterium phocae TaxID=131112 RepID=UPI001C0F1B3E|nr:hypothetical protein [Arcanobacterium phocae]
MESSVKDGEVTSKSVGYFDLTRKKNAKREKGAASEKEQPWWRYLLIDFGFAAISSFSFLLPLLLAYFNFIPKTGVASPAKLLHNINTYFLDEGNCGSFSTNIPLFFNVLAAVGVAATVALSNASERIELIVNNNSIQKSSSESDVKGKISNLKYYQALQLFLFLFRVIILFSLAVLCIRGQYALIIGVSLFYAFIFIQSRMVGRYIVSLPRPLYEAKVWERAQKSVALACGNNTESRKARRKYEILRWIQRSLTILFSILIPVLLWKGGGGTLAVSVGVGFLLIDFFLHYFRRDSIPAMGNRADSLMTIILFSSAANISIVLVSLSAIRYISLSTFLSILLYIIMIVCPVSIAAIDITLAWQAERGKNYSYYLGKALIEVHKAQVERRNTRQNSERRGWYKRLSSPRPTVYKIDNPEGYFPLEESIDKKTKKTSYTLPVMKTYESKQFPGYFVLNVWDYFWTEGKKGICEELCYRASLKLSWLRRKINCLTRNENSSQSLVD